MRVKKEVSPEKKGPGRPKTKDVPDSTPREGRNIVELDPETAFFFKWLGRGDIALGAQRAANYIFSIEWKDIGDIRDGPYNSKK